MLQQSGNPKIAAGPAGLLRSGRFVRELEMPTRLDRGEGDVHAAGNPHIQTDPRNIARVADGAGAAPGSSIRRNAAIYQARYKDFAARWQRGDRAAGSSRRRRCKGVPVVVAAQDLGLPAATGWACSEVAALEPKPGVEPSAAHLSELLAQLQRQPAKMVLRAAYQDGRASRWLAERAQIPAVMLPFTVGGNDEAKDLFGLFDDTIARLLAAAPEMNLDATRSDASSRPALVAGLLVLATHVPLGMQVLERGHRLHRPRDRADRRRSA